MAKSIINTALVLQLADSNIRTDAARYGNNLTGGDGFSATLAKEAAERREKAETAAASEILDLIEIKNAKVLANAQQKAALQAQIAELDKNSEMLAKAEAYGFDSRNFLPLALLSGQSAPAGANKDLLTIPKDWVQPAPRETAAPAATPAAA